MSEFKLDLNNTAVAFATKSDAALREKYWLFSSMNSPLLTSLGTQSVQIALSLGLPVKGLIKNTIFKQFCGGETIEECNRTIKELGQSNIGTILDYSVEGKSDERELENTKKEILRAIKRAEGDKNIPFSVFKMTGVARFALLEKVSAGEQLTDAESAEWERTRGRVREICEAANSIAQPIFIDAEETWIQQAIDDLVTEMMMVFNREKHIVFNTLQLYRTDRLEFLKKSHEHARATGYFYGVKLVRGAYMEKERERAAEKGYPSPIHPDKESTDRDYDAAVEYCFQNFEEVCFVNASHNDDSVELLARLMHERNVPKNHPNIHFSQLLGMSDNLSYVLADAGYNVSKYVPYGPVKDAMPYLMRRAKENTAVMGQMSRELELIDKEIKRRKSLQHLPPSKRNQESENVLPEMRKR